MDQKDSSGDLVRKEHIADTGLNATPVSNGEKTVRKIIRRKRRPARPQVDPATFKTEPPPQTGVTFNIWYNKWSGGDRESSQASQTHAKGRCIVATDSGYTAADNITGSYFCLFFARGVCPKGSDCPYLHRLPTVTDIFNPNIDCFGRDRFSDYRDDMGGVGSFMRPNRTIYVGRIHVTDDIEEVVARHFGEWGQVERIRVLDTRGVAFITYTNEANAQFAKEAMAHQSLDHDEVLNVRWATVDPNPMAQAREARRIEEQAADAIRSILPADYVAELEGKDPEARKRRRIEGSYNLQGYDAPDNVWFSRALGDTNSSSVASRGGKPPLKPENSSTEARSGSTSSVTGRQESSHGSSILSESTLASLMRQREQNGTLAVKVLKERKPTAALVDYGSDEDSD